jgi:molecular chaperone GrpE (heat shock protein)
MIFDDYSDRPDKKYDLSDSGCERENGDSADREGEDRNDAAESEVPSLEDWENALRRDFESWLESVNSISAPEDEPSADPDLYSFYEQLTVTNAETRKANRRAAEAFSRWGDALVGFEADLQLVREQLSHRQMATTEDAPLPRKFCLALIEMFDRLRRIALAFESTPEKSWWKSGDAEWRQIWETQREAFLILIGHFEDLLAGEGVMRMECLGRPFDPTEMNAVATDSDALQTDNLVVEEYAPGYQRNGELLRPAQVKINVNRSERTSS